MARTSSVRPIKGVDPTPSPTQNPDPEPEHGPERDPDRERGPDHKPDHGGCPAINAVLGGGGWGRSARERHGPESNQSDDRAPEPDHEPAYKPDHEPVPKPDQRTLGESNPKVAADQGIHPGTTSAGHGPCKTPGHGTMKHIVELLAAYSHTPTRLDDLRKTVDIVRRQESDDPDDGRNEAASRPSRWTLADRLSPADVQTIIDLHQGGTPTKGLAAKFGISARSVRRLLRKHDGCLSHREDAAGR
jgi:hypothetical protein